MSNEHPIEGRWVSTLPDDTDDYVVEYVIRCNGAGFDVSARDLQDNEKMEISAIRWENEILSFRSLMPSTGRVGFSQFRLMANGNIESKFTFTILEELKRAD